ncbi:transcription factor SCREAM2-like isoform X1 [Senna tora]|uniref:Transcription factor SCREAM2-like isoform X1 n=1 Tax=Senna tora TaxID=362788 RepID=A0A834T993_9FABA|nr:transcription factor SCREAM2-like isoform X1 [Senna tora]
MGGWQVRIETLEKGFVINVLAAKSCPGLLVSLLEAFDGMDLDVQQARVSCTHTFRFQALATQNKEEEGMSMDAQDVKQAVGQAIKKWRESHYPTWVFPRDPTNLGIHYLQNKLAQPTLKIFINLRSEERY